MLEYCIGEVGLRPEEFWSMTFEEVNFACKGYERREARKKEVERLTATILLNVYRGSHPAYRPEDVYPLASDRKRTLMTKDEYKEVNEFFNKIRWQNSG